MSNLLSKRHFVCTDLEKNSNKFWVIELYDNSTITTTYGRVGTPGYRENKTFGSQIAAQKYFDNKIKDKQKVKNRRDSYTEITILSENISVEKNNHISDIAINEIETNSQKAKELVKFLSDVNIHTITSNTQIKYNVDDGSFKTALGVVDKTSIDNAKKLLDEISKYIIINDFSNPLLTKSVNQYFRYVPQDLGGSNVKIRLKDLFRDMDAIEKQNEILQSLEASISTAKKVESNGVKIFNTALREASDVKDEIDNLFRKTKQGRHISHQYSVKNVYKIEIKSVIDAWSEYGSKMSNIWRLWHGTSAGNVLSILKSGLIIPKNYSNGRNFGDGAYFSDVSTKSLNYACGYWSGKSEIKALMFLCDVAMGNFYKPTTTCKKIPNGYNSIYADPSEYRGLLNPEMIVPRTDQINLVYLVEFE